jgi:hypothetical protein
MFVLTALAMLQAAPPPAAADWKAMSTQELAARLLPPELAKVAREHEFSPRTTTNGQPAEVTFYTKVYQMPDGFCERDVYHVPVGAKAAMMQDADMRLGDCLPVRTDGLARVDLGPSLQVAQAKAAMRWLANAITAARTDQALDFDVSCVAKGRPGRCSGGARAALAGLSAENILTMAGAFTCRTSETRFTLRSDAGAWDVRLARGKARPRLTLRPMASSGRS